MEKLVDRVMTKILVVMIYNYKNHYYFYCYIHLIPRREGDVENPRGGVRGVIPNKQKYGKDAIRIWEGGNFY